MSMALLTNDLRTICNAFKASTKHYPLARLANNASVVEKTDSPFFPIYEVTWYSTVRRDPIWVIQKTDKEQLDLRYTILDDQKELSKLGESEKIIEDEISSIERYYLFQKFLFESARKLKLNFYIKGILGFFRQYNSYFSQEGESAFPSDFLVGELTSFVLKTWHVPPPQEFPIVEVATPRSPQYVGSPYEIPVRPFLWRRSGDPPGKCRTFYLHPDVVESFVMQLYEWCAQNKYVITITGTTRTVKESDDAKLRKGNLVLSGGYSLHNYGRAVDIWINTVRKNDVLKFYTHMQQARWYTIFNFPNQRVIYKYRESWHLQYTDGNGQRSGVFLDKYCQKLGIQNRKNIKFVYLEKENKPYYDIFVKGGLNGLSNGEWQGSFSTL